MATTTTDTFTWPTPAKKLVRAYLKERTSGAADAPHQVLPFISEAGILRVKPATHGQSQNADKQNFLHRCSP